MNYSPNQLDTFHAVRPGTEAPAQIPCPGCGMAVLVPVGETEARCSNCGKWAHR